MQSESSSASSLGATDLHDYTDRVLDLVSSAVQRGRDTQQCCDYPYQMLDKHCASRTVVRHNAISTSTPTTACSILSVLFSIIMPCIGKIRLWLCFGAGRTRNDMWSHDIFSLSSLPQMLIVSIHTLTLPY